MSFEGPFSFPTEKQDFHQRLDLFVAGRLADCSRSYVAALVRDGKIRVNDAIVKPGYRLKPGDMVTGKIPAPEILDVNPENIPLDFIYEDEHLAVINKPAGMVVHPAPGNYSGTVVNAMLYHCPDLGRIGGDIRPGIVHRLDKDTSGVLAVAKNGIAHDLISRQFKDRTVKKKYLAIAHGSMEKERGAVELPIGRHPIERKKMAVRKDGGRRARTLWRIRERYQGFCALDLDLETGRTHQIRVHCAAIHHPIVGDSVYGGAGKKLGRDVVEGVRQLIKDVTRQMLHAEKLQLTHPVSGDTLVFVAPVPEDMQRLMDNLSTFTC